MNGAPVSCSCVCVHLCLSVSLSPSVAVSLPLSLSLFLSLRLSVSLSLYLSLSLCLSVSLSVSVSVSLPVSLYTYMCFVYLSICLCVCVSVCLPVLGLYHVLAGCGCNQALKSTRPPKPRRLAWRVPVLTGTSRGAVWPMRRVVPARARARRGPARCCRCPSPRTFEVHTRHHDNARAHVRWVCTHTCGPARHSTTSNARLLCSPLLIVSCTRFLIALRVYVHMITSTSEVHLHVAHCLTLPTSRCYLGMLPPRCQCQVGGFLETLARGV